MHRKAFFIALVWFAAVPCGSAANPLETGVVRAGVFVSPPFVIEESYGGYGGLAVDLWETVARGISLRTEYVPYPSVRDLPLATEQGEVDIAVLTIAVTYDRANRLRFSFPWFDSGLRMMVNKESTSTFWSEMSRFRHFRVYLVFFLIFTVMALVMTFLRRRLDPKFPEDWKTGFTKSLLDVVASVKSGRLDQSYLGWIGSLISVGWMVFGVAAAAYITSSITSAMTTVSLNRGGINTLAELTDKRVGVLTGSISEDFLESLDMQVVGFDTIPDAAKALVAKDVQAVVSDGPILSYFMRSNPELPITLAGDPFQEEKYGFVSGLGNRSFMDRVSEELIWLHETDKIASLRQRYVDGPP